MVQNLAIRSSGIESMLAPQAPLAGRVVLLTALKARCAEVATQHQWNEHDRELWLNVLTPAMFSEVAAFAPVAPQAWSEWLPPGVLGGEASVSLLACAWVAGHWPYLLAMADQPEVVARERRSVQPGTLWWSLAHVKDEWWGGTPVLTQATRVRLILLWEDLWQHHRMMRWTTQSELWTCSTWNMVRDAVAVRSGVTARLVVPALTMLTRSRPPNDFQQDAVWLSAVAYRLWQVPWVRFPSWMEEHWGSWARWMSHWMTGWWSDRPARRRARRPDEAPVMWTRVMLIRHAVADAVMVVGVTPAGAECGPTWMRTDEWEAMSGQGPWWFLPAGRRVTVPALSTALKLDRWQGRIPRLRWPLRNRTSTGVLVSSAQMSAAVTGWSSEAPMPILRPCARRRKKRRPRRSRMNWPVPAVVWTAAARRALQPLVVRMDADQRFVWSLWSWRHPGLVTFQWSGYATDSLSDLMRRSLRWVALHLTPAELTEAVSPRTGLVRRVMDSLKTDTWSAVEQLLWSDLHRFSLLSLWVSRPRDAEAISRTARRIRREAALDLEVMPQATAAVWWPLMHMPQWPGRIRRLIWQAVVLSGRIPTQEPLMPPSSALAVDPATVATWPMPAINVEASPVQDPVYRAQWNRHTMRLHLSQPMNQSRLWAPERAYQTQLTVMGEEATGRGVIMEVLTSLWREVQHRGLLVRGDDGLWVWGRGVERADNVHVAWAVGWISSYAVAYGLYLPYRLSSEVWRWMMSAITDANAVPYFPRRLAEGRAVFRGMDLKDAQASVCCEHAECSTDWTPFLAAHWLASRDVLSGFRYGWMQFRWSVSLDGWCAIANDVWARPDASMSWTLERWKATMVMRSEDDEAIVQWVGTLPPERQARLAEFIVGQARLPELEVGETPWSIYWVEQGLELPQAQNCFHRLVMPKRGRWRVGRVAPATQWTPPDLDRLFAPVMEFPTVFGHQ